MISDIKLSELLSARLCHDLAGPISAVSNGAELLIDGSDGIYEQALDLVDSSAKEAVARVLFYRMAYGASQSETATSMSSIKQLANNFFESKKIEVIWQDNAADYVEASGLKGGDIKIILNLMLITANTLIYGGSISAMAGVYKKKERISMKGEGRAVKIDPEVIGLLSGNKDEHKITVSNVNAYLTLMMLNDSGVKASVNNNDKFIEIIVT